MIIEYTTNTAREEDIVSHLRECNGHFTPVLSSRVDLNHFAGKISEKAVTLEAWAAGRLVGLLSAYFNDTVHRTGYINNVSVVKEYRGKGVATELLNRCIRHATERGFEKITLEVSKTSSGAMRLYRKTGFEDSGVNGEFLVMQREIRNPGGASPASRLVRTG